MKKRTGLIATLLVGINALIVPTASSKHQFLVRIKSSAHCIRDPADRHDLNVVRSVGSGGSYLVTSSEDLAEGVLGRIQSDPDVDVVERVSEVRLPEFQRRAGSHDFKDSIRAWLSAANARRLLASRTFVEYFGASVWDPYLKQPTVRITQVAKAHRIATGRGVTVAIIDTGIARHPALERSLVSGYDFLHDRPGATEEDLDGADFDSARLQQGTTVVINNVPRPTLSGNSERAFGGGDYSAPAVGEHATLGHGTMIAGAVHLVAPEARIMPLRVFGSDGSTDTAKIIRAIYYAVDHGAGVINMSFSTSDLSAELLRAVNYATRKGVICVASAGNQGQATMVFPASLANVVGVAATDDRDHRSAFSNYGPDVAAVAAPGEGIVTTYLDDAYAIGWGTSFSTALVSGGAALLLDISPNLGYFQLADSLSRTAKRVNDDDPEGRVDFWLAARRTSMTRALHQVGPQEPE
jgi:subtilisin family serine protease